MRSIVRSIAAACCAVAVFSGAPAIAEKRVALVIGNGAYVHTRVLPNARNDARTIAALLAKIGFVVTEASDLSYRPMREAIRAFGQTAQGAEMALVYYAGHGLEVAGENWLLPVSAAFKHERDLEYEAVSLSSLLTAVKDAGRLRLVILDACRNNPLGDRIELSATTPRAVSRGLARIEPSGDILVAYSAKHGTLAEDGPAGGNSPFAAALALNLGTPGLDVRIMLGKVRDAVKKATGGRQEPFTYGSVGGDTIALHPGDGPAIAPALPRPVVVPPPQPQVAIGKLPEVKPAPRFDAPEEALPENIPISAEVLRLVETHPFFANAPPVLARSYHVVRTTSHAGGATTVYNSKSTVRWLRRGLIKVDRTTQETTIQSGRRFPGTRRESEVLAANGFLVLGSTSTYGGGTPDLEKLLRIENMKGHIFPVRVGNRYSYEATYHQEIMGKRTNKLSCEVTGKYEAKSLHAELTGAAYVEVCTHQVRYPSKGITNDGQQKSYICNYSPLCGVVTRV